VYQLYGYVNPEEEDLSHIGYFASGFLIGPDIFITSYKFSREVYDDPVFCSNSVLPSLKRINRSTHTQLRLIDIQTNVPLEDNGNDPITGNELDTCKISFMQVTRRIAAGFVTSQAALQYLIPTSSKIFPGMAVGAIGYSPLRVNQYLQFY
jgi:hypothetical protein